MLTLSVAPFSAQAIVWNTKTSANCTSGCTSTTLGNSQTFSGSETGSPSVAVSAFSTNPVSTNANQTFQTATLALYNGNGLGATAQSGDGTLGDVPHHAFDNDGSATTGPDLPDGGAVDAALFSFDQTVTLTSISIGWSQYDSDLSILAYSPTNSQAQNAPSIVGKTFSELLSSGWQLVGNYANLGSTSSTVSYTGSTAISTSISSSYWLVSAYTSCANANSGNNYTCTAGPAANGGTLDFGNDYFKIAGLGGNLSTSGGGGSANNNGVPEPTSLLLISIGFLGWRLHRNPRTYDSLAA